MYVDTHSVLFSFCIQLYSNVISFRSVEMHRSLQRTTFYLLVLSASFNVILDFLPFTQCCSISFHSASIYILSSFFFFLLKCVYHYSERQSICWCCVGHLTLSSSFLFYTVLFYVCSSICILCSFHSTSIYILSSFLSVLLQCIYHYSERHSICWC
jgi:hypothetical protein